MSADRWTELEALAKATPEWECTPMLPETVLDLIAAARTADTDEQRVQSTDRTDQPMTEITKKDAVRVDRQANR